LKILIIDDDEETCKAIIAFLTLKGHQAVGVSDGREGIEKINADTFDRIILDMSMPDFSGMDVLQKLKETNKLENNKIVVYSAVAMSQEEIDVIAKKGGSFLSKSQGMNELVQTLMTC